MGHLKEHHLLGRLRCHIFPSVRDDCWVFLRVLIKFDQPTRGKLCYLNRETQKLVPRRNFSHLDPQKFVPTNHKKSQIRKIKLPQNFHCTRYVICGIHYQGTFPLTLITELFNTYFQGGFKRKQLLFFIYYSEFIIIAIFPETRTGLIYGNGGTLSPSLLLQM